MKFKRLKFSWLSVGLVISLILNGLLAGKVWWKGSESLKVTVTGVVDGDTVDVSSGERVRLMGIDAPEYPKGCLSKRSKDRMEELVLGKEVKIDKTGEYSFERVVAKISVDGLDVSKVMVTEGLAVVWGDTSDEIELAEIESVAAKRGIWSSECTSAREGCEIKGNFHKGTKDKVYHLPNCYNYKQVNINPNESDRWFCTEEEAEAAGFVKSKDCPREK